MNFAPVIPGTGLVGWQFLQRTYDAQLQSFSASTALQRDIAYFEENISEISSAEDLVANRQLLNVALGAFGLQEDLPNKYFIQRILGDGTSDDGALANRLADSRYRNLSDAFGLGPGGPLKTGSGDAMGKVVAQFKQQQFEQAVGEQDETMRIALFAQRELPDLASGNQSDSAKWFSIMGQPPLRKLFETTLGLPVSFGGIDIDKQLEVFQDRARSILGDESIAQYADPEAVEKLITIYQARSQISAFAAQTSSASTALTLLQSA
jgi:uncharacterized protein DUF1217